MTDVFVRVGIKAWNKSISIRTDRRKHLAACVLRIMLVGCMNAHQFDARGRQGRKTYFWTFIFPAIRTEARTAVGKGEQCVPCDPGYELRKGGRLTSNAQKIHVDGTEKTQAYMNLFPALFGACVSIGWMLYQPIHLSKNNTRYLEV